MKERGEIYLPPEGKFFELGKSMFLFGEIDGNTVEKTLLWLAKKENDDSIKEINFYIDSIGGDVWGCIVLAQAMRVCSKPINTIGIGRVYSGAALILAAGDAGRRSLWQNAEVMIHDIQIKMSRFEGPPDELEKLKKEVDKINERWISEIARLTGQPIERVRKDARKERYFTPEEAVSYGFADKIIASPKRRVYGKLEDSNNEGEKP